MAKTKTVTMVRKDGTVLKVSEENAKIFEKCGYKIKKGNESKTPDNDGAQTPEK